MSGTRVTCTDVETGESESAVIENDYVLICDGNRYLDGIVTHANGTVVITVKRRAKQPPSADESNRQDGA